MSRINFLAILFVYMVVFGQGVAAQDIQERPFPGSPLSKEDQEKRKALNEKRKSEFNNSFNEWLNGKFSPDTYKLKPGDDDESRLKKQRINVALMIMDHFERLRDLGMGDIVTTHKFQKRILAAQLEFHTKPKEIVSALQDAFESAKQLEAMLRDTFNGRGFQFGKATYDRLDIEIKLLLANKEFGLFDDGKENKKVPDLPTELDNPRQESNDSNEDWLNGDFSPEPYKLNRGDDEEARLKKQRINMALMEMAHLERFHDAGFLMLGDALESQQRLVAAQLDFHTKPQAIISVLQKALKAAIQTETLVKDQFNKGAGGNIQQMSQSMYHRLDAEIRLLRAKKKHGLLEDSAEKEIDDETRLMKQRIDVALQEQQHFERLNQAGVGMRDAEWESQQRLLAAQLEFQTKPQEIVSSLRHALEAAKRTETIFMNRYIAGSEVTKADVCQAAYNRLDSDIRLLRANKKYGLFEDAHKLPVP